MDLVEARKNLDKLKTNDQLLKELDDSVLTFAQLQHVAAIRKDQQRRIDNIETSLGLRG